MKKEERNAFEEEKAGIQLGREYDSDFNTTNEEDVKESVKIVNPDVNTLERG